MTRSIAVALFTLAAGTAAHAQSPRGQCSAAGLWQNYCERIVDAAMTPPARLAITAAGGSPTAGTASTLGMRLPGSPRVSATLRGTLARAEVPVVDVSDDDGTDSFTAATLALDASVGLFQGWNLAPTIGGFGAVDAIASAGLLDLWSGDELQLSSSFTWGAGLRVGILRESFTAPGVSVSAMYRSLPDISWRHPEITTRYGARSQSAWSLRGTVGKRVLGAGLTGGIGYDRVRADVHGQFTPPSPIIIEPTRVGGSVTDTRLNAFGGLSYTTTIFNFSAELGWQQNGERAEGAHRSTRRGGLFGSAAIRLTI